MKLCFKDFSVLLLLFSLVFSSHSPPPNPIFVGIYESNNFKIKKDKQNYFFTVDIALAAFYALSLKARTGIPLKYFKVCL